MMKMTTDSAMSAAIDLLVEKLLGLTFSGDVIHEALVNMMINSKQGSVGLEEAICRMLGLKHSTAKHGYDATKGLQEYELKPIRVKDKISITFNDITVDKCEKLKSQIVVIARIIDGVLSEVWEVSGESVSKVLMDKMDSTKSRQTYHVSMNQILQYEKNPRLVYYRKHTARHCRLLLEQCVPTCHFVSKWKKRLTEGK